MTADEHLKQERELQRRVQAAELVVREPSISFGAKRERLTKLANAREALRAHRLRGHE